MNSYDTVTFYGHPLIVASHRSTFEITREEEITKRGDCVIGVKADKAAADLEPALGQILRSDQTRVKLKLAVGRFSCEIRGWGSRRLTLSSTRDLVVRRSNFTCDRTLAINCDLAAADLPRAIINRLKNPEARATLVISV